MKQKLAEVYAYFKKQYPRSLLLFHVNDSYVTYSSDLTTISEILGEDAIPECEIANAMSALGKAGDVVKIIEYRNEDGEYSLPDIEEIEREKTADY